MLITIFVPSLTSIGYDAIKSFIIYISLPVILAVFIASCKLKKYCTVPSSSPLFSLLFFIIATAFCGFPIKYSLCNPSIVCSIYKKYPFGTEFTSPVNAIGASIYPS